MPSVVAAELVDVEIISITIESGADKNNVYATIRTSANSDFLPELNEYICIFGEDNCLKSATVFQPETNGSKTDVLIGNNFDISTDYMKIFVWDKDMKPYSISNALPIKNIKRIQSHIDGGGLSGGHIGSSSSGIQNVER